MEESSGGANGTGDEALVAPDIDRVLSMAIEQSKRDVDNTCTVLGISPGESRTFLLIYLVVIQYAVISLTIHFNCVVYTKLQTTI